jgi:hypothetical protein
VFSVGRTRSYLGRNQKRNINKELNEIEENIYKLKGKFCKSCVYKYLKTEHFQEEVIIIET